MGQAPQPWPLHCPAVGVSSHGVDPQMIKLEVVAKSEDAVLCAVPNIDSAMSGAFDESTCSKAFDMYHSREPFAADLFAEYLGSFPAKVYKDAPV